MSAAGSSETFLLCPKCGVENFDFASFCISCGEPLGSGLGAPLSGTLDFADTKAAHDEDIPLTTSSSSSSRRRSRLLETCLGLAILVLVMGYALYNWEHTSAQSSAYHQGMVASVQKDWDKAAADFARAGDYIDAAQRARDARQKAAERDRLYSEALQAQRETDWERALTALQQVYAIQPSYLDTNSRLAALEDRVFNKGLAGLVYVVRQGSAPGLYLRDANGKASLVPGSDGGSTIHAISADGKAFVYDVPGLRIGELKTDDGQPAPLDSNSAVTAPGENPGARRVEVAAHFDPDGSLDIVPLLDLPASGTGVFAGQGLWWYSPLGQSLQQNGRSAVAYEVFYASLGTDRRVVRISDLSVGKRVIAVDPPHSRVVLAVPVSQPPADYWQTDIFVANASGGEARIVQTVPGQVIQGSISSDGRWLLVSTQENSSNAERLVLGVRLDAAGAGPAQPALRQLDVTLPSGSRPGVSPGAAFIPSTTGKHLVLLTRRDADGNNLEICDLDSGNVSLLWNGPLTGASSYFRSVTSALSPDGRYAVVRQQESGGASLIMLNLGAPLSNQSSAALPDDAGQVLRLQFGPQSAYLLASTAIRQTYGLGSSLQVYAARVLPGGQLGDLQRVATTLYARGSQVPTVAMPSDDLLAFVNTGGDLHAVFADGTGDTVVAKGVSGVWSLGSPLDLSPVPFGFGR